MKKPFSNIILQYIAISSIIIIFFINNFAFKERKPTCDNYVVNTYLYLALSICVVGLSVFTYNYLLNSNDTLNKYLPIDKTFEQLKSYFWPNILITFGLVIAIAFQPMFIKQGFVFQHLLWLLFIASISFLLYPYFKSFSTAQYVDEALIMTSFVFILMSLVVYFYPSFFENKEFSRKLFLSLFISLIVIIILELSFILTKNYSKSKSKYVSYFVILIFSVFVSYDTSKMLEYAKSCVNYPNYPKASTRFFLDIVNLFVRFIRVSKN